MHSTNHFPLDLHEGIFLKRYKRFLVDIIYQGQPMTIHSTNTGSLKGCTAENAPCWFTKNDDPKRKLKGTWEAIQIGKQWIGVNTARANDFTWNILLNLPEYSKYKHRAKEVKINGASRSDFVLWNQDLGYVKPRVEDFHQHKGFHIIEVKNVTLVEDEIAKFPDSVTTRGQKHIEDLMQLMSLGHTAEFLFVIRRSDCHSFRPAWEIDPTYSELLYKAVHKGLKVSTYIADISTNGLLLNPKKLDFIQP